MSSFSPPTIVVKDETNLEAVRFTLHWSIHDFEGLKNKDKYMYSPGITMAELGMDESFRGRWRIGVKPCHSVTEINVEKRYVSVSLALTTEDLKPTKYTGERTLSCTFKERVTTGKLMDVPIRTAAEFSELRTFSSDGGNTWGHHKFIAHLDLFGSGAKALKDSCLNFETSVILYREPKSVRASEAVSSSLSQRHQEFLGRQLKQQAAGGDFLLVSNDKKEFHVDRSFLMAHSPVFTAMLNHDSKEKQTSRCETKDVDGECVEILLDYVYGCETRKIQGSNAEKVLAMADKYQLMDLRGVCELMLAKDISVDNAVNVFALARQRNLGTLKDAAVKFIRKNMDVEAILDEYLDV